MGSCCGEEVAVEAQAALLPGLGGTVCHLKNISWMVPWYLQEFCSPDKCFLAVEESSVDSLMPNAGFDVPVALLSA